MNIHVTGGRGFLAGYIVPRLREAHDVDVSDRETMDVTDYSAVRERLEESRPDMVVHLAALCGAQPSRDRPPEFFACNAQGTVNVLEACRRLGIKRFLLASSMTVFGSGETAREEDAPFAPRHPYAVSKVAAEFAARNYSQDFGLKIITVRPTLVVGEGCKEPHAVGDFVATVRAGKDIVIYGDGSHRRDFVHPEDVADAVRRLADRLAEPAGPAYESFNISMGQAFRMAELADRVIALLGRGRRIHGPASNQSFSLFASIDRARQLLHYHPRVQIDDMIRRLADQPLTLGAA